LTVRFFLVSSRSLGNSIYGKDLESSSSLPDFVPNTIPEELTVAPDTAPKDGLAASSQAERNILDIDVDEVDIVMAPPRKVLTLFFFVLQQLVADLAMGEL